MKTTKLFVITIVIGLSSYYVQGQNIKKDIKMYTQVWDDIVNNGEIDKINSTYFDTNITAIQSPKNIVGLENFKAYYQNFITGFSNIEFTIIDVFGVENKIVKHWNFKGTHTGDFFGIPATNRTVDIQGVTIAKIKNGKIAQEQDFMDNAVFMQQLGLVSNPENISIINGLYNAFAKGDIPTVLSGMEATIVWNEAESNSLADGNPYVGPDAILNGVFARLGANHVYFKLADIELHDMSNNQVLATLRYDAKNKATGKVYNAQAAHLWTLKNGKVIAFQQYVDTKKLADAENK
jgi:hypothetical protein